MWSQIQSNKRKSVFYASLMGVFLVVVGFAFGEVLLQGIDGAALGCVAAILVWLVLLFTSIASGDKILLASAGAKRITHDDFPQLFNIVEEMKIASGLPVMPEVYLIDDPIPNAFATGRGPNRSAVAVTSGLVSKLNREELQGVISHEMSHIVNRDVMLMSVLGITLGAIVLLSHSFLRMRFFGGGRRSSNNGGGQAQLVIFLVSLIFVILAPIFAQMIYFAVSRKREYLADACGAQYSRYPDGLASALEKISSVPGEMQSANKVTAPMYIVNPFAKLRNVSGLFSTHPPTIERIKALRGMGGVVSLASYQKSFAINAKDGKSGALFSAADIATKLYHGPTGAADFVSRQTAPQSAVVASAETYTPASMPVAERGDMNDFFWKNEGYKIIECSCGLKIKIPPKFEKDHIYCTKCGIKYMLAKA